MSEMFPWISHLGPVHLCYQQISRFYGDRRAARSGVRLMNHIDEGLIILHELKASEWAQAAYCLHPMVQDDQELAKFYKGQCERCHLALTTTGPFAEVIPAVVLALEYRRLANSYLSSGPFNYEQMAQQMAQTLARMPLPEVRIMLIADKVQNRKDFERYHWATHPRSAELEQYFANWMQLLGISELQYAHWCSKINKPQRKDADSSYIEQ